MIQRSSLLALIVGLAAFGFVAPVSADWTDGLVSYWPFEGSLDDTHGIHHGSEFGTDPIPFEEGKFGNAILLAGDQYVQVDGGDEDPIHEEAFDFTFVEGEDDTGSVSISTWFKADTFDKSWQALIAKGEGSGWRLHRRGGEMEMAYTGGTGGDGDANGVAIEFGEWYHVVALTDAGLVHNGEEGDEPETHSKRLYLNGELIASGTGAQLEDRTNFMMIGNNPDSPSRQWQGSIDDVAIWDRPLTPDEITTLYSDGNGVALSALLTPVDLPGDFDGNGALEFADFLTMANNFNTEGDYSQGDFNLDGKINLRDFQGFREAFAAAAGAGEAASVPEPTCFLLFGLGTLTGAASLRRRRR